MLSNRELCDVSAGVNWAIVGIGGTIVSFFIGLFDGYIRPLKCNR